MNRREHLQQDEHAARERQRAGQAVAALDGADEHAHRHGEDGGQHAAQHEHEPPAGRERQVGLVEHGEELPFLARAQTAQHVGSSSFREDPIIRARAGRL